jgi:TatD DNase family protein
VDTHTHLCDQVFDKDRADVLERAKAANVSAIIIVSEDLADAKRNIELASKHPTLKPAAGLYPAILDQAQAREMHAFIRKKREKLVAIGEVGLDHWIVKEESEKALQRTIFKGFIELGIDFRHFFLQWILSPVHTH